MDLGRFLQAARQGCVNPLWHAQCHGKDSPSPPPAPDYTGAAQATSQGSAQAAIANNLMMHPNIYTPLGSQTWNYAGEGNVPAVGGQPGFSVPTYSQSINMTPQGKDLYDRQVNLSSGLLGLGQGALNQTAASLGKPQDMSSVGDIANQAYSAQTSRLDPEWAARQKQFDAQMANQGISAGGEAYDNAARDFGQQRNDAYTQARQQAIATMPQTYQLSTAQRMQPLTELNAIRSGSQPQMPQFQATQYSGGMQGPNMGQAVGQQGQYDQGIYNAEVGQSNSQTQGLMGLATMAAMFF